MADTGAAMNGAEPIKKSIPDGYAAQTEGLVTILQKGNEVFYNPAQIVNRDLSIAVIRYFIQQRSLEISQQQQSRRNRLGGSDGSLGNQTKVHGIEILEGLAASGLRSIRYAKEIEGVSRVVANDMDPSVVDAMKRNIEFNEAGDLVVPSVGDARIVMMQNPNIFDVIDLDPYGSPCQLLDSAVQCVKSGGLLCVTATDMAVLCGNNSEACFAKYGSYPLHRSYCHEMAVRIVLNAISTAAARSKRYIVPILSCSIDFYVRMFVRVYESAAETKNTGTKLGYVYQSLGCDSFYWQRVARKIEKGNGFKYAPGIGPAVPQQCPETGQGFSMGGPFWAEPIHDVIWVKGILAAVRASRKQYGAFEKIQGLLTTCSEELPDVPFYFNVHDVCKTLRATAMRHEVFRSAVLNAGYRVSGTHCNPLGIKTDAPWHVIWDIMRCWCIQHPSKPTPGSSGEKILSKEPELKADFSRAPTAVQYKPKGKGKKITRFPQNPEANWGPKTKHGRVVKPRLNERKNSEQNNAAVVEKGEVQAGGGLGAGEELNDDIEMQNTNVDDNVNAAGDKQPENEERLRQ